MQVRFVRLILRQNSLPTRKVQTCTRSIFFNAHLTPGFFVCRKTGMNRKGTLFSEV